MKSVESRTERPILSINEVLHRLVMEQRGLKILDGQITNFSSRKALFGWYQKTENFKSAYREAETHWIVPQTSYRRERLRDYFAGRVFQDMAYMYCDLTFANGSSVFSPDKTLKFWRALYPNCSVIKSPFGQDSLDGVSVPDGMIVDGEKEKSILGVFEYTLVKDEEYLRRKYEFFRNLKKIFPEFFDKAYFLFVIPKTDPLPYVSKGGTVRFVELPFTRVEFGHFINGILGRYRRDDDSASLIEVAKRGIEQKDSIIKHMTSGGGTSEEVTYLSKYGGHFGRVLAPFSIGEWKVTVTIVDFTSPNSKNSS